MRGRSGLATKPGGKGACQSHKLPRRSLLCRSLAWSPVPAPGPFFFSLPISTGTHQFTATGHVPGVQGTSPSPGGRSGWHEAAVAGISERLLQLLPRRGQVLCDAAGASPTPLNDSSGQGCPPGNQTNKLLRGEASPWGGEGREQRQKERRPGNRRTTKIRTIRKTGQENPGRWKDGLKGDG